MINRNIENSIVKFLTNQATASDLQELEKWIEKEDNKILFDEYVKINYVIEYNMNEFDSHKLRMKLLEAFDKERKGNKIKKLRKVIYYSAAAVILGIVGTTYFYLQSLSNIPESKVIQNNVITAGTDKAILTLEDGTSVVLDKDRKYEKGNFSKVLNFGKVKRSAKYLN